MDTSIIVALLAFAGTALGTIVGARQNTKHVTYRIEQLEKKVEKHNDVIRRTYILEEKIKVANHRLDDIENK
jgi:hypothetical protein